MTEVTVSSLMTTVGEVFTTAIGWVGDVAAEITGNPLLLMCCVGLPLLGIGITVFKRLMHARAGG